MQCGFMDQRKIHELFKRFHCIDELADLPKYTKVPKYSKDNSEYISCLLWNKYIVAEKM